MIRSALKQTLVNTLWLLLGRGNFVRLARYLNNEARLDVKNDPATNGESRIQSALFRSPPAGDAYCVFDVGANVGEWTRNVCRIAAEAKASVSVHAFEPCAATEAMLRRNLEVWGVDRLVRTNCVGLSARGGRRAFYEIGPGIGTNSLHPVYGAEPIEAPEVELSTVDAYCSELGIGAIDCLKIDAEGHDFEILLGCRSLLESQRIGFLQFEYNHRWIDARHYLRDAFDLLQPLGYALGKITPKGVEFYPGWDSELETFREANFLALPQRRIGEIPTIDWWKRPFRLDSEAA